MRCFPAKFMDAPTVSVEDTAGEVVGAGVGESWAIIEFPINKELIKTKVVSKFLIFLCFNFRLIILKRERFKPLRSYLINYLMGFV
jgi:hypothetical protein